MTFVAVIAALLMLVLVRLNVLLLRRRHHLLLRRNRLLLGWQTLFGGFNDRPAPPPANRVSEVEAQKEASRMSCVSRQRRRRRR